jgi:hypothetical protein
MPFPWRTYFRDRLSGPGQGAAVSLHGPQFGQQEEGYAAKIERVRTTMSLHSRSGRLFFQ